MHSLYFCYDSWIIRHKWFRVVVVVVAVVVVVVIVTRDVDFLYLFLFCSFSTSNGGTNMYAKQFVNRSGNKEKNKKSTSRVTITTTTTTATTTTTPCPFSCKPYHCISISQYLWVAGATIHPREGSMSAWIEH
jgi:hypothetical protein